MHLGKGKKQTLGGILVTSSEPTLVPGDLTYPYDSPVRVGGYGGQITMEFSPGSTHILSGGSLKTHSVVISPVIKWIIRIDILNNCSNPHFSSLACKVRAVLEGKARWKSVEKPLFRKILNNNNTTFLERVWKSVPPPRIQGL